MPQPSSPVFRPIKLVDLDVGDGFGDIEGLEGYGELRALVRLHGAPIGYVSLPVVGARCSAGALARLIADQHGATIFRRLVCGRLIAPPSFVAERIEDSVDASPGRKELAAPLVTVAVCTRDRAANLRLCLDALAQLRYPRLECLVVDNAPATDAAERVVRTYPHIRYVREPRPGLNWARNRAILEAAGDIVAYTDDDVVVDPRWIDALVPLFAEHPDVMAVTGLVVPYELETEPEVLFEQRGGFGRGFERRWYRLRDEGGSTAVGHMQAWRFGTGANMAFRKSVFAQIGAFDPALDVGTVTNGGGDLEMFFRVLEEGHTLVYEPAALVRHRHRREYGALRFQMRDNGTGRSAFLLRVACAYPGRRAAVALFWLRSVWRHFWRLAFSLLRPDGFPRDLVVADLQGSLMGLVRYPQARRIAARIERAFRPITSTVIDRTDDGGPPAKSFPSSAVR